MSEASSQFVEFIVEQLAGIGRIKSARFFGGTGLSIDAKQFAMVMGSTLYFVVDNTTRPKYEALGSECFAYNTKAKRVQVKKYYQVPAETIDDQDALVALARESIHIAQANKR